MTATIRAFEGIFAMAIYYQYILEHNLERLEYIMEKDSLFRASVRFEL